MLDSYVAALRRGWSPNTIRPVAGLEELRELERGQQRFLRSLVDREAAGPPIPPSDGSLGKRLPGYRMWMWDGEFCGSIGLRWPQGTSELPSHVLGHIGYSVVPWKQRRGYATQALALILVDAADEGLEQVGLTTDVDNVPSQRVIVANGGELVGRVQRDPVYGDVEQMLYRVSLKPA
jgi:predicted acetyltransferase